MVTADPVPVAQETLAEQAIAECPRAACRAKTRPLTITSQAR